MATRVTAADLADGAYNGRLVREETNGALGMSVYVLRSAEPHMGRVRVTLARLAYVFEDVQAATPGKDFRERHALENVFYIMGAAAEPHQLAGFCGAPYCVLEREHVGGHRVAGQAVAGAL